MKGTTFIKPLELNIRIAGESWSQGDVISGLLIIKNHGTQAASLQDNRVSLAYGRLKKVHEKAEGAYKILSTVSLQSIPELQPGKEFEFPWKFEMDRNAPITDNVKSLFILYGSEAAPGHLQLPIQPYWTVLEFLEVFKVGFRFVVKSKKANKDSVEVKLAPPDGAKAYAALELCTLFFHFEGDTMNVEYVFLQKKIQASAASVDVTKQKKAFEQSFAQNQILLESGRFNHEPIEAAIRDALAQL